MSFKFDPTVRTVNKQYKYCTVPELLQHAERVFHREVFFYDGMIQVWYRTCQYP